MADPTHEESHGVESTPSAASIRHYELLETAYQLVKEFNAQGTSSFFHREDSSSAGMFSIHDPAVLNRIKTLRGNDQEPAPASIHTLLEVLHEVDPGFRLPTGFHANNIGNAKKFLKYFEHSKDLTLLAGKVNAAYSQLAVLPQAQLSQLREKHPEELAKEAEHDKKHQEGGKEGEAKVLEPYWKTLPVEIHEEKPRKEEAQQELVEKAAEAPQREEAATVISQQAPSPTKLQRLQTLTSKLPLASARNTLSRALLPIGKFIQRNAGAVIPGLITGAYGAARGGLALGILYGAGGVAVGAGTSALAKRGKSGGPAAQATITAPIPAPSPEPQEAASNESPPPRRGFPFRRGAPAESPFSTVARGLRIFGPGRTFWIGAGVGLFLILFIMFLGNPGQGGGLNINLPNIPSLNSGGTSQVTIIKSQVNCKEENGYCVANNGDQIEYSLAVVYTGAGAANVQVHDTLPDKTECVSASDTTCDSSTKTVSWELKDLPANQPKTLSLIIRPTSPDIWVVNKATANVDGGGGGIVDAASGSIADLFNKAAQYAQIPVAFLKAIANNESGVLSYTDNEVAFFSQPNWWSSSDITDAQLRRGYAYNTCSDPSLGCQNSTVEGPMQFLVSTFNSLAGQLKFTDQHTPDPRILVDAVYASALYNKQHAVSLGVTSSDNWTEDTVRKVARMYCSGSPDPASVLNAACGYQGGLTYDDRVWEAYKQYSETQ